MQLAISGLEGDVEDQLMHVRKLNDNLSPLDQFLEKIADLDRKCEEANIEENDFTTYTYDELSYELGLVKNSVSKKTRVSGQPSCRSEYDKFDPYSA